MPILVADYIVQALVKVRLQAKCAELSLALVLHHRLFLRRFLLTTISRALLTLIKLLVEVWVNGL